MKISLMTWILDMPFKSRKRKVLTSGDVWHQNQVLRVMAFVVIELFSPGFFFSFVVLWRTQTCARTSKVYWSVINEISSELVTASSSSSKILFLFFSRVKKCRKFFSMDFTLFKTFSIITVLTSQTSLSDKLYMSHLQTTFFRPYFSFSSKLMWDINASSKKWCQRVCLLILPVNHQLQAKSCWSWLSLFHSFSYIY